MIETIKDIAKSFLSRLIKNVLTKGESIFYHKFFIKNKMIIFKSKNRWKLF